MKEFINLTIELPEEYFELAAAALMDFTFLGIKEENDSLVVTFDRDDYNNEIKNEIISSIQQFYQNAKVVGEELVSPQNWNEEWEKNVPLIKVSDKIEIMPEWRKHEGSAEIQIIINPKMSFGTGQHETTRLTCRLIEKYAQSDQYWIDVGTGTGVLAILLAKLGSFVFAFDNNEWSIQNAQENIQLNNCQEKITLKFLDLDDIDLPMANGIVANLYGNLIISNLNKFHCSLSILNGKLIVSGVLRYQEEELIEAAKIYGFEVIEKIYEEEWIAVAFRAV